MFSILNTMFMRSPKMQEYIAQHPDSLYARLYARNNPMPTTNTTGSNNAGTNMVAPNQQPNQSTMRYGNITGSNNAQNSYAPNGLSAGMFGGSRGSEPNAQPSIVSFAAGGMMTAAGTAVRPGAAMNSAIPADEPMLGADAPAPMNGAQIDQEAKKFAMSHPDVMQKVQGVLVTAMQSGELTHDELNLAVQLAKAAIANPASYPQVRKFAIENGLGTEADFPQEMDRGLLFTLLVAGKALQAGGQGTTQTNAMEGQKSAGLVPEYGDGGMTGDKKHLAMVHPREYVIPEDTLLYHGKKHFDKLVEQARTPKDAN